MAQSPIASAQSVTLDAAGEVVWAKNPDALDFVIMSVTKMFTAHYARQALTTLSASTTLADAAPATAPSLPKLYGQDTLTVADLFHATMLASDNLGATQIARAAQAARGETVWAPWWGQQMTDWYAAEFGFTGHSFSTPSGLSDNFASARQAAEVLRTIATVDPWLLDVMGTPQYEVSITAAPFGPRTYTAIHNNYSDVDTEFPEWVASKGGSGGSTVAFAVAWDAPNQSRFYTAIIGSPSTSARYADLRVIIDDVVGMEVDPDPDPPGDPSGLFRTNGNPVTLARTNGAPVILA